MLTKIKAWAETHTSKKRYSPVGVAFHWGMALVIALMLWLGWRMGRIDVGGAKLDAFQLHMIIGLVTLILAALRLSWRLVIPGPVNDADNLGIQTKIARVIHGLFYICFVGLPVSGWLTWSAFAGNEQLNLGLITIPAFPFDKFAFEKKSQILYWAGSLHYVLIWVLIIIIPAHAGAALKHHFWDRHDVLIGMLPILALDEKLVEKDTSKTTALKARPRKQIVAQSQKVSKPVKSPA